MIWLTVLIEAEILIQAAAVWLWLRRNRQPSAAETAEAVRIERIRGERQPTLWTDAYAPLPKRDQ